MYIADDRIAFNLQGLRFLKTTNKQYSTMSRMEYYIELQYKGSQTTVAYETKKERDEIFNLAVKYLKATTIGKKDALEP